jgi:3-mercaptopropionate dioxygenase
MDAAAPMTQVDRVPVPEALRRFIWDIQSMVELAESEREILMIGGDLMSRLVRSDLWLPAAFAAPSPGGCQFQIYSDAMERFCVVSTILAGGAALSIAQPGVWEIMGTVRGSIARRALGGVGDDRVLQPRAVETLRSGRTDGVRLANALGGEVAIAIHVYGGDIGKLSRRPEGEADAPPLGYANGEDAPPYDIFSIQADIRD